jgi:hypothetical protein
LFQFKSVQSLFNSWQVGIGTVRFLSPAKTGERFERRRHTVASRHPITIGAVCIHIHVRLKEQRAAFGFRVLQCQHRLAVVEIVTREQQVQPIQTLAQLAHFGLIKLRKEWGNCFGVGHCRQARQQVAKIRTHLSELIHTAIWRRHPRVQFQIDYVTHRVDPFFGCGCASRRFHFAAQGDAIEQPRHVELAGEHRRSGRRC